MAAQQERLNNEQQSTLEILQLTSHTYAAWHEVEHGCALRSASGYGKVPLALSL